MGSELIWTFLHISLATSFVIIVLLLAVPALPPIIYLQIILSIVICKTTPSKNSLMGGLQRILTKM